jgi:hypothetical protein
MPRRPYHGRVLRNVSRFRIGALPVLGVLTMLAACGEPPTPSLTAPPEAPGGGSASASAYPSGLVPIVPTTLPTATVPTYPTAPVPTYPVATTTRPPTTTTTSPRTPGPPPAPKCTNGPTGQQVLAVVKDRPGIPDNELKVIEGPFCAGEWQFAVVEIVPGASEEKVEPLLVVTNGKPATLKVIEAGTDVCSVKVRNEAPTGIRVRACGG